MHIDGSGLLVSLPAEELRGLTLRASVFELKDLPVGSLSEELRWALRAATLHCEAKRAPLFIVARPEIFTHDKSLSWLIGRIGGIKDHLCLSDGSTIRALQGLRNHLFLYRQESHAHHLAFERLLKWVPQLLESVQSQINTRISARDERRNLAPPALLLQAALPSEEAAPLVPLTASLARATPRPIPLRIQHLTYVPLTETALYDTAFMRSVVALLRSSLKAADAGVILRAPRPSAEHSPEARRLATLETLRTAGLKTLPRVGKVWLLASDLATSQLGTDDRLIDLYAHHTFPFWRHTAKYLAGFRSRRIWSGGAARITREWQELVDEAAGGPP